MTASAIPSCACGSRDWCSLRRYTVLACAALGPDGRFGPEEESPADTDSLDFRCGGCGERPDAAGRAALSAAYDA